MRKIRAIVLKIWILNFNSKKESGELKKVIAIILMLVTSIACALYFGVYMFSRDNINNRNEGLITNTFTPSDGLVLENWIETEIGFTASTNDPIINITEAVNSYIRNIRFDGTIEIDDNTLVQLYYTESEEEIFSEEKSMLIAPEKKNSDFYLSINRNLYKFRIDLYNEAGKNAVINGIEINPQKLNVNTVICVVAFGLPLVLLSGLFIVVFYFQQLKGYMKGIIKYRYLLQDLVTKDIKTKYRRSVLGILWSVLNPLLMMLVLTAVFANIFRFDIKDFPVYYLTGYLIFSFVSESTSFSLTSIISAAGLIKKVYIPKYIFPLEKCLFSFVNMLFSMIAIIIVFAILGIAPHWTVILFPIPMIYTFVFSFGLSLILAMFNVFFRDTGHLWGVFVTVWMYLTPIIYPINILPDWMISIVKINPLYYYVEYFRSIMIYGTVPGLIDNLVCISFSGIMLLLGLILFKKYQDKFILYI